MSSTLSLKNPVHEREMNKHDPSYLPACGAVPITIIERDAIRASPARLAGSLALLRT